MRINSQFFAGLSSVFLFTSFVLLLLVTLSAPVIQSISFVEFYLHEGIFKGSTYQFGLWGFCIVNLPEAVYPNG
jgi:hypothetical protein